MGDSRYDEIIFQEELRCSETKFEYMIFSMLKPKLFIDGNQWCVLYGDDIQSGITGFGETPNKAILDWNRAWHKKAKTT